MTHSHMDSSIYILASLALDLADRHWRPGEMPREIWQPMRNLIGAGQGTYARTLQEQAIVDLINNHFPS